MFLLVQFTYAQTGTVSGVITDAETEETIIGATVYIPDLDRGATSNVDGEYTLENLPVGTHTLRISFIGYQTIIEDIVVNAGEVTEANFALESGVVGLDELVVTGYGVQERREITGSQSGVRARDIEDITLQSAEQILQGRAAGVNIRTTSGNPGGAMQVQVRGTGSINAASEPLYIVDGVPMSFSSLGMPSDASSSPLNAINPSDIESIEVLKDAAAASIYGSQAASGVVLITTKRGAAGDTQISARAETGFRSMAENVDYLNTEEWVDYYGDAIFHNNPGLTREQGRDAAEDFLLGFFGPAPGTEQLANTDWQDIIYRDDALSKKYNVSARGGVERTNFFISGSFEDTEGHVTRSHFDRLNLRTNIDHEMTDRLRASVNINLARSNQSGVCQNGNFINCAISQAMFLPPMTFAWADEEQTEYQPHHPFWGVSSNPVATQREVDRDVSTLSIVSNIDLDYRATDWLNVRGSVGLDYRDVEEIQHRTPIISPAAGGFTRIHDRRIENYTANLTANARYSFDDVHNISGLLGTEFRSDWSQRITVTGEGFPGTFFKVLDASADPTTASGTETEWRIGSYFGNVRYNYDQRYYLTFTSRLDGHSRFGADTRWGFFPSVSGAWNLSDEEFFNIEQIEELRFRASYGLTGNAEIGNFAARGLYSAVGSYRGSTGLTPTQLANVNLGWEQAEEINVGMDYSVFRGRLSGSVDAYTRENKELLFDRPLPSDSGFDDITENIGVVQNQGIEVDIRSVNIHTDDFTWNTNFNIAFERNEILELPDGEDINPNSNFNSLQEGESIGLIQVVRWAGVNPADGRPMWYDADGNITYTPTEDDFVKYNDGKSNMTGGFGNTLSYRGITLDAFFEFQVGQWGFGSTDAYFTRTPDFFMNLHSKVKDRWKEPGDITRVPRAIQSGTDYLETANYRTTEGTHIINNASYIRLKNVTLSYSLPVDVTNTLGIRNLRLFASGINLVTWTQWPWYDPEIAFDTRDIFQNVTTASFPTAKQINFGIEVDF